MAPGIGNLKKRAVITGLGVVAPNGIGKDAFWEAVVEGRSGIDWVRSFDASDLYCQVAGEVRDFDPTDYMDAHDVRRSGRFVHFAMAASRLAVEDAEIDLTRLDPFRVGAIVGSSVGASGNIADDVYATYYAKGPRACGALDHVLLAPHTATAYVTIAFGMKGPNASTATGCCASLEAIASARDILRSGQADVMVVSGTEACVSRFGMSLLCRTNVLTHRNEEPSKASRPYDATRDGLVLSEGAGALVVETAEHALGRGAHIYAEVCGFGSTTEGTHLVVPDASGIELASAFRAALLDSRLAPEEIDYVCAHGIANRDYDIADTRAIKQVLGPRAYNIPVSSIKSTTGQPFAAGGAWQAAVACMSIQTNTVPPTTNYGTPDPQCDLDYVPNKARSVRVNATMINSHSFGGTHAALILRAFDEHLGARN